jgi:hypothetical protein
VAPAAVLGHWSGPSGIDARARDRTRTLVETIVDAIGVCIFGTAARIHLCAVDGVGAGVEAVVDQVVVRICGAAARIYDRAAGGSGTGVLLIGDSIPIAIVEGAGPAEDGQSHRAYDMTGPRPARIVRVRRVDGARLDAYRDAFAQEHPVAERTMNAIVGEGVARIVGEPQATVSAEDIEEVVVASEIDDQTAAAQRDGRNGATRGRRRLLIGDIELEADGRAEEVAEATATADLVIEAKGAVIARE